MVSLNSSILIRHGSRSILKSRFSSHHVYTQAIFTCGPRWNPGDLQAQQLGQSRKLDETRTVPGFQDLSEMERATFMLVKIQNRFVVYNLPIANDP